MASPPPLPGDASAHHPADEVHGDDVGPRPLPVYARSTPVPRLGWAGRAVAAAVAAGALAVLTVAAVITPDDRGIGTHEQLGLKPCGLVVMWGLPCPTCGFTTSFALFVRGRWLESVWNQPMAFLAALVTAMTVWAAAYVAVTGSRAYGLLAGLLTPSRLTALLALALLAWAWKVALMLWMS